MGLTERCCCQLCRHLGNGIHRTWVEQLVARGCYSEAVEDFERELAKRWHEYGPKMSSLIASVPRHAAHLTFTAAETSALQQLRDWNDRVGAYNGDEYDPDCNRCMCVLAGSVGVGKTVAVTWLALHRLANEDPMFITGPELARVSLMRFGEDHEVQRAQLFESGALIVDDLGAEKPNRSFQADFDELVDHAYQAGVLLVLTTNCTPPEFKRRYGARVVDRMAERGEWINVRGPSMRINPPPDSRAA